MNNNILQNEVSIDHDLHIYYKNDGSTLWSVSKFIGLFKEDTDFEKIAGFVAKKRKKKYEEMAIKRNKTILEIALNQPKYSRAFTQKTVLKEWEQKKNEAIDAGNYLHSHLENSFLTGKYPDDDYVDYYKWVSNYFRTYKKVHAEQILYLDDFRLAGTADKICFRTSARGMVDIRDYKTNDLTYDSLGQDQFTKETKHYNRYMTGCLSHLEDCDYTKYSLQLSIYMYMLESMGYKPGNLAIIQVPWRKNLAEPKLIHIPYMRHEVIAMLEEKKSVLLKNVSKTVEMDETEYHTIHTL